MTRIALPVIIIAAAMLSSCAPGPDAAQKPAPPAAGEIVAEGTVVALSATHGNAYTDIKPVQYEALGLRAGDWIQVAFADTAVTMIVGKDYTDVPTGTPLAVLHREGLTFAIRDGNFSATYGVGAGDGFVIRASVRP
jgi:S-adenosylmethionine hydrolase